MHLIFVIVFSTFTQTYCQSVAESDKRGIVRIETPEGMLGTGFLLIDPDLGGLLVTSKHLLQSKIDGKYFDSVAIRKNLILKSGKVVATNERSTLYLRYKGIELFEGHPDSSIDFVLVQIGKLLIDTAVFVINPSNYMLCPT